eukprot:106020-Amphidinium_carterae.1
MTWNMSSSVARTFGHPGGELSGPLRDANDTCWSCSGVRLVGGWQAAAGTVRLEKGVIAWYGATWYKLDQ